MKKLFLLVPLVGSVLGCLLFGCVFLLTFLSPEVIDRSARGFVVQQIEKELLKVKGLEQVGRVAEKVSWLRERYAAKIPSRPEQLEGGVRQKVVEILNTVCDVECHKKSGKSLTRLANQAIEERLTKFTDASQRLSEFVKEKYYALIAELLRDLRIFSAINTLVFFLVALLLSSRSRLARPLAVPAMLLFVATLVCIGAYLFGQNWFYALFYSSYVGWGYAGYIGIVFLFLVDIVFNDAEVTLTLLDSVSLGVE